MKTLIMVIHTISFITIFCRCITMIQIHHAQWLFTISDLGLGPRNLELTEPKFATGHSESVHIFDPRSFEIHGSILTSLEHLIIINKTSGLTEIENGYLSIAIIVSCV